DEEAREWFKKLEDGDEEALKLWKWFREESLKKFTEVYDRLNITFDSYNGEAFYNDKMDEITDLLQEKGLLKESQGAEIVDLEKYDLNPALIRKTDGATL
ncbi:arginine--tRNA ligase, partial [Lactobacillus salivarius]|nr:arginine--tRNA ligase [Ligilactobacillus salivarius]